MKQPRKPVNLHLTLEEYDALAADAAELGTRPTTLALSHVLASMQEYRGVSSDLFSPAVAATHAMKAAGEALREAGDTEAAAAVDAAGQRLSDAIRKGRERNTMLMDSVRLAAYRHRVDWETGVPRNWRVDYSLLLAGLGSQ